MLTIEQLKQYGADTQAGLKRCMNNEAFYLRLVTMALQDANFGKLAAAVEADDRKSAFEAVHALKGVTGNLALTPLYKACSEMTELLRTDKDADYSAPHQEIRRLYEALKAL